MTPAARSVLNWGRRLGATVHLAGVLGEGSRLSVELRGERLALVERGSGYMAHQALTLTETGGRRPEAPVLLAQGRLTPRATRRVLASLGYG